MAFFQALVIGLLALILVPGYSFYFDVEPKVAVLLFGTAALLVLAALRRDLPRGPRWFTWLLVGNGVSLAVSCALSTHRALSLYGGTWRAFGAAVQVAAMLFAWTVARSAIGHGERVRTLLRAVTLTGIASGAYGMAQYFGWDPLIPPASYRVGEGVWSIVRPPGTFGYASYFATWLAMTVFLSLELAGRETSPWWRRLAQAGAAISLAAMLLTGTRAALVGLVAGAVLGGWWSGFRVSRRMAAAGLAVLVCAAAFYFSPLGLQLRSRSRWFREDPRGGARLLLWRDSLRMAAHKLLAGFGPETFLTEFPRYESPALAEAYPDFVHESPHNIFLDALVAQGIPGMALAAGWCALGLFAAWRAKSAWMGAALAAGIVSQQFTAFTVPTAVLFFTTIALAAGTACESVPAQRATRLTALAALPLLYLALRLTMADHALALARRDLAASQYSAAEADYAAYRSWRLPGASADVWYARAWMDVARTARDPRLVRQAVLASRAAAVRATTSSEQPFEAWYTLAELAASGENYTVTESALRQAIAAHPNWFKAHWTLAQELALEGRLGEAGQEAALAARLDAGHHPEVAQTLADIRARQAGGR